ncbi:hypothetical protein KAU85_01740 [Candidatus Bathyarchaeota archaeon]|nr:hypothetical protein [Candidatus Bathyarchaeota archaeon]MCK4482366.1 hypothetical protein [Candidatus Bathyarchaeota archaeon]
MVDRDLVDRRELYRGPCGIYGICKDAEESLERLPRHFEVQQKKRDAKVSWLQPTLLRIRQQNCKLFKRLKPRVCYQGNEYENAICGKVQKSEGLTKSE